MPEQNWQPAGRLQVGDVLRNEGVPAFIASRFFSNFARSLFAATLAWHAWKLTGSYFWLGVIGFVEFLPVIPVSLYAGALADTRNRRTIVLWTQSAMAIGTSLLGYAAFAEGQEMTIALLLLAAVVLSAAACFENPAGASILPTLVPRIEFATATVVHSNFRNVARMSGPVAMGVVTGWFGIAAGYCLAALATVLAIGLLLRVHPLRLEVHESRPVTFSAIREGIAFVRNQPAVFGSMALDMFAVIFAGATAMLPVFADEILQVGEMGYGILSASMQVGTTTMAIILLLVPPIERPGRALLVAVGLFGLSTVVFGLSRWFPLSVAAFVVAGMADQVSMVTRSVILQLATPDALRGRVNSVNMVFIGASNELGAAESGFLAALTSATFSVVGGGLACLATLGFVARRVPELRGYRVD